MSEEARKAGRGGLAVLTAKLFFLATGLVQQALLPKAIGKADYGALARVAAVTNVLNNVIVSSSTQGVSRTVAPAGEHEREALRMTLRVHLGLALIATAILVCGAPLVAHVQHAPEILAPLVAMGGVLLVYGVYAPLVGYINGRGMFVRQATLDMVAATLRTAGLLGIGWFFAKNAQGIAATLGTLPGMLGASIGAVLAACGVFLLALRWTGTGRAWTGERPPAVPTARAYVSLIVPVMLAQLCVNALMQTDIFLLGRYASISAVASGAADPVKASNEWVGVYRACQLFAFLPYQLLFSVTQVLFPMLAKAQAEGDRPRVAELVARGSRIGTVFCGLVVSVIAALPWSMIHFAYGKDFANDGSEVLQLLVLAQAAFAIASLGTTILVSLARERGAMMLTALAVVLLAGACFLLIPGAEFGKGQLRAAALGAAIALGLALVVVVVVVRWVAGAFVPWKTALRVGLFVGGVSIARAYLYGEHFGRLVTIVAAGGVAVAYLAYLVVTRELGREDLGLLLSVVRRRANR